MKKQVTIKELKEQGFRVDIYHGRKFVFNSLKVKQDNEILITTGEDLFMSRRDFKNAENKIKDSYSLSNQGGFTMLTLTKDGKELKGKFNVPSGSQFNRRVALDSAINKALGN